MITLRNINLVTPSDEELVTVVCIKKGPKNKDDPRDLTSFSDFINIGETYLALKRAYLYDGKIVNPDWHDNTDISPNTRYYDIYDLNKNRIGNFPTNYFRIISTYRTKQIETILNE